MKSNSKAKAKLEGERLLYLNDKEKKCKIRIAVYKEKNGHRRMRRVKQWDFSHIVYHSHREQ